MSRLRNPTSSFFETFDITNKEDTSDRWTELPSRLNHVVDDDAPILFFFNYLYTGAVTSTQLVD